MSALYWPARLLCALVAAAFIVPFIALFAAFMLPIYAINALACCLVWGLSGNWRNPLRDPWGLE